MESGAGTETVTGVEGGSGDVNGHGDGDGAEMRTGTEVEVSEKMQDGNGDGNGYEIEDSSGDGNGDEDYGNEYRIEEGGREAKKREKRKTAEDAMWETGETWVERAKKCGKERVGPSSCQPR